MVSPSRNIKNPLPFLSNGYHTAALIIVYVVILCKRYIIKFANNGTNRNRNRNRNMFTLKIETDETTSLRTWPDVIIHRKGCQTFEDLIEDERQKWNESPGVIESIELYDCILVSTCGQFEFYKTVGDTIYITNQSGKTVEILR